MMCITISCRISIDEPQKDMSGHPGARSLCELSEVVDTYQTPRLAMHQPASELAAWLAADQGHHQQQKERDTSPRTRHDFSEVNGLFLGALDGSSRNDNLASLEAGTVGTYRTHRRYLQWMTSLRETGLAPWRVCIHPAFF